MCPETENTYVLFLRVTVVPDSGVKIYSNIDIMLEKVQTLVGASVNSWSISENFLVDRTSVIPTQRLVGLFMSLN